ncbi:UvrD-helicase domain-containing protein [Propionicimonas paludicola]|uniref:UvrD-helicase domain-containing protein n=1 Tax=Propionicimonas paludicola TaxID=185243 RepID=UPI00117ADDB3|nr:UvrD-helicase domain-containing protein [Propionicimonas paludicola]
MSQLSVRRWWFGHALVVRQRSTRRFHGVPKADVASLRHAIQWHVDRAQVQSTLERACVFQSHYSALLAHHLVEQRWIPHDRVAQVMALCPTPEELERLGRLPIEDLTTPEERDALALLARDPIAAIQTANERILHGELTAEAAFFAGIESQPLTPEQALAVVAFDSRVRVIAAAGSGKTSVMVARAAYAQERGFVAPDRILMLAFNKDAASELRARVASRLAARELPAGGIQATTFHSFGRALIGHATGRKPTIAPWVENGSDVDKVSRIIDELREASPDFRFKWDMFRLIYSRVSERPDLEEPDSYDRSKRRTGFHTYRGEIVRSEGERMIADWLFLNGVDYRYEQPYSHDVADKEHSQYRPDFFYPQIDAWHEHWALGADGAPPPSFTGYADGMRWKRALHRKYGTSLIETTWHEIVNLNGFSALADQLQRRGLELDWNPDRPISGIPAATHERLAQLMRTFLSHVKAGSLSRGDLDARLTSQPSRRSRLFLELFWQIFDRWQDDLAALGAIDFDDMVIQAADLLERHPSLRTFDLVLVDEFQDTSRSRARLVKALCDKPEAYLLAVGDDWQAINRFAGADLSAMTEFDSFFGATTTLRLQTTFRNTQRIADVAGRFISRNPGQLPKRVVASSPLTNAAPVVVVRVESRQQLRPTIERHLLDLAARYPTASIDVLGRYSHERDLVPRRLLAGPRVSFRTIHSAKGLEADHVVLPNLTTGTFGLPSQIDDDPVIGLAMARDDEFPHSEERRLFYVALTRARHTVTIFTIAGLESPFVVELLQDQDVVVQDSSGNRDPVQPCPKCGQGTVRFKVSEYGPFSYCCRFPRCDYKADVVSSVGPAKPQRTRQGSGRVAGASAQSRRRIRS